MQTTDQETDLLASCRRALRQYGANSSEWQTLFERFHKLYYGRVYGWAANRVGRFLADDVAERTLTRAWQWLQSDAALVAADALIGRCYSLALADHFRAWWGREMQNAQDTVAEDENLAGRQRAVARNVNLEEDLRKPDSQLESRTTEDIVLERESDHRVLRAFSALTAQQRATIIHRCILKQSVTETATRLGRTVSEVKHDKKRGLEKLAPLLENDENPA